ncbi:MULTISPECIES: type II toxin-antitoxin system VapC family toxin [unclassified Mesorhizobium]|uniref:type II toxin-antitoxin system VapC family toxin n=1 Tax=unclassified Mesorhizobium TaxID=325217 RepID=UPI000FDC6D71|nr:MULTISPECIES: type II toxin-antitoxin system VapC family toxin [unclassified Mesorhizobium]TGQ12256.1 PIN domain-containing protein [Mesorhizobium sp. M2E.F.Ca.ET.219.01.1.1]TGT68077.1 PIN domain-containing protein [Mesorhizobium sp. M2E.F.Ca.ET.166.01.1.1]TGW01079.1 PIN domain-containing protein [Mesorhizobium sp. M2E.F.Ca.ET.154.01.1.1]
MPGALLDTHTLYWLVTAAGTLSEEALVAIADGQSSGTLYVSPITAWELTIASRKPAHKDPPNLGTGTPSKWFSAAVAATGAKIVPIKQRIACEAAAVITDTGHKDPGDCYLIATARVRRVPIITRDALMFSLASPDYLEVIVC